MNAYKPKLTSNKLSSHNKPTLMLVMYCGDINDQITRPSEPRENELSFGKKVSPIFARDIPGAISKSAKKIKKPKRSLFI